MPSLHARTLHSSTQQYVSLCRCRRERQCLSPNETPKTPMIVAIIIANGLQCGALARSPVRAMCVHRVVLAAAYIYEYENPTKELRRWRWVCVCIDRQVVAKHKVIFIRVNACRSLHCLHEKPFSETISRPLNAIRIGRTKHFSFRRQLECNTLLVYLTSFRSNSFFHFKFNLPKSFFSVATDRNERKSWVRLMCSTHVGMWDKYDIGSY